MSVEVKDEAFDPDKIIGMTLASRYQIETRLGEGAMGTVYRAKHVKVGRAFAVKVLHSHLLEDKKVQQRFEREAELAGRLRHPNVIGVVDVGEMGDGTRYMVMDFAEGPDLATMLSEAPMPPHRVIHLVRQLLEGLFHAHEAGLIHRDFKPENVIVEKDTHGAEVPRIVDFGIAILREGGDSATSPGRLTTNGLVLGTPHYMAPEQAVADPIDHRIDLFALGIIIYEMLCGKLPFDGSGAEVARANLLLDPPLISERVPYLEVDPLLEAFARRLMAKKRDLRPATAKAARELLDLIVSDRSAAAAALGVPLDAARQPMTTQPSTPIAPRSHNSNDTFPPPLRSGLETPPQAPALAAPVAVAAGSRSPLQTDVVRSAPRRKRAWLAVAIGGLGAAGVAVAVLAATSGGGDKADEPSDKRAMQTTPPAPEPAPVPTPTPTPAPPVEVAKQPDPPAPPPVEDVKPTKVAATSHVKKVVKKDEPKPPPVEAPKPDVTPKTVDADTFAAQYRKVGEELAAYEAAKGADAAADLRNHYRLIRYGEAIGDAQKRQDGAAILSKIHQTIGNH